MSKQSLLLVDGDTRSLRVLEVSLRKAGFTVTAATSVQDALDKLELHAPDLIISETTFPDGDGFELRRRVRGTPDWAEIPFIFLTAEAAIENKIRGLELGVDDYLTKPIYIKEIVTRINILLQKRQRIRFEERKDGRTRFAGRVADMPVVDVIQTIEISRKSGVIQFVGERGRQAAIYFRDGKVIDAEAGTLQGEDAVYRLLTWNEGEFEVVFRTVRRREVITMSSQGLLMEGMRRLDEWSRLLEQLPPLSHRFEIDTGELAARLSDVPDDNNRILRLIDGKRTLLEVIEASDVGDLECLQVIARLYFEELLIDLDHGKPARRDTGKPMPLVEVEAPAGEDDGSGPHGSKSGQIDVPSAVGSGPVVAATPVDELDSIAESGPITDSELVDESEVVSEEPEPDRPGALLGGYRPSSLRLIDEAVAAAQAIEPSLFEDDPSAPAVPAPAPATTTSAVPVPVPAPVPAPAPVASPVVSPRTTSRDESGLRIIGSLGRDRAEASGELVPIGATPPVTETQRELVTILPRRITRELQAIQTPPPPPSSPASTPSTPSSPPGPPPSTPPAPPAPTSPADAPIATPRTLSPVPKLATTGSGVVRRRGPSPGALALLGLAALLGVIAIVMWARGPDAPSQPASPPDPQVGAAAPVDAGIAVPRVDAALVRDASARTVSVDAAPRPDAAPSPIARAKELYEQSQQALAAGDFARALELADASLALRRTARAFLVRAQSLEQLGRVEDAIAATEAAAKLAPTYGTVYEIRGNILWAQKRWDAAREAYYHLLEIEPNSQRAAQIRKRLQEQP